MRRPRKLTTHITRKKEAERESMLVSKHLIIGLLKGRSGQKPKKRSKFMTRQSADAILANIEQTIGSWIRPVYSIDLPVRFADDVNENQNEFPVSWIRAPDDPFTWDSFPHAAIHHQQIQPPPSALGRMLREGGFTEIQRGLCVNNEHEWVQSQITDPDNGSVTQRLICTACWAQMEYVYNSLHGSSRRD